MGKSIEFKEFREQTGAMGGNQRALNHAKIWIATAEQKHKKVFDALIANPAAKQKEIEELTGIPQSFISKVLCPELQAVRLKSASIGKIEKISAARYNTFLVYFLGAHCRAWIRAHEYLPKPSKTDSKIMLGE